MGEELKELTPEETTTLESSAIYVVLQTSETNALTEGAVYVWVGSDLSQRRDAILDATNKARKFIGTTSKAVYVSITIA